MSANQTSKFISCNASSVWQLANSNSFTSGDVDGDGRIEVIVFNGDADLPALGVLSYFKYGDVSPAWAGDSQYNVLSTWTTGGQVPNGGWVFSPDDMFSCADLDGSGAQQVVAVKLGNPSDLTYPCYLGTLKWQIDQTSGYNNILVQYVNTCVVQLGGVQGTLYISNIYVGDLDGDGADEVVAVGTFKTNSTEGTPSMAVFKWVNNALTPLWAGSALSGAGWYIDPHDRFYVADLDGDGHAEVLAFKQSSDAQPRPGPCRLGVLKWADSTKGMSVTWAADSYLSGNTMWMFDNIDQFYCADLDGDGAAEILCFKPQSDTPQYPCYLGVFKWSDAVSEVQVLWAINSGVVGQNMWNFSTIDQFYCADLDGDGAAEILCFKPQSDTPEYPCYLGVFKWAGTADGVQVLWLTDSHITGNNWWSFSTTDRLYCVDIDGNGKAEVVAFKPGDPCGNYQQYNCYLGVFAWDGTAVSVLWETGKNTVPAWSIDIFTGIPSQGLTPFTTQGEQWAYAYISNYFDPYSNGDIRSKYDIWTSLTPESLGAWAVKLRDGKPTEPQDAPVTQQEWSMVQQVLAPEFDGVANTIALIRQLAKYAKTLYNNASHTDLPNCRNNLKTPQTVSSTLSYWPGQFGVMMLWGLAALPFGPAWAVTVGMTASMVGSMLSAPSDPLSVDIDGLNDACENVLAQLATTYDQSINQYQAELNQYLNDETKLQLVGYLAENAWAWSDLQEEVPIAVSVSNSNRLSFYQQLIPVVYKILVWNNCTLNGPCHRHELPRGRFEWRLIENVPEGAYWAQQVGPQRWNVYLLCQGGAKSVCDESPKFIYPSNDLTSDLFKTLGVNKEEFFTGQKGWCGIKQETTPYPDC